MAAAKAALDRGDNAAAIDSLDQVISIDPAHAEALVYRAQLARDAGDEPGALALVRRVPPGPGPMGGVAKFIEGSLLLSAGDAGGAESCWRQSIEWHPGYRQPRSALIELLLTQLRGAEARQQILDSRRLAPLSLVQLVQYQASFTELARPADSRVLLARLLEHAPADRPLRIALIRDDLAAREFDDSVRRIREGLELAPQDADYTGLLIEALCRGQRVAEASSEWAKAGSIDLSKSVWGWRGMAALADATGDWQATAAGWWHVVQSQPFDQHAHYRLAVALERSELPDAATTQSRRTREVERLVEFISHILKGDTSRGHLVADMVRQIVESLLALRRPADARLWLDFLLSQSPPGETSQRLVRRLAEVEQAMGDGDSQEQLLGQLLASRSAEANRASGGSRLSPRPTFERESTRDAAPLPAFDGQTESSPSVPSRIRLVDQHAEAGLSFQHFNGPTEFKYLLESLGGGVGVLDYDRDGWPDLYFPQGCSIPYDPGSMTYLDHLSRNRGDGTFVETTTSAEVRENQYSQGIAIGDFNEDGFADVAVGNYGRTTLLLNDGDGTFSDVSTALRPGEEHWNSSLAWGDLDRDGDLDLYIVNYVLGATKVCREPGGTVRACSPANFEGEPDLLFLNEGDGTFRNIPLAAAGLGGAEGKGLGIVVAHLDEDDWPDIYVSNDGTPNFFFRHSGVVRDGIPQYAEEGLLSGAALSADGRSQAGMGIACADLTGDQRNDLYVTHFYNDYNTLYSNEGQGLFRDVTHDLRLAEPTMRLLGFGTQAIDLDLDGWQDLLLANGHIDDFRHDSIPWTMPMQLFRNRAGRAWTDESKSAGEALTRETLGRAVARLDVNRDGRPDAVVVHQDQPVSLLVNQTDQAGNSLTVQLIGRDSNRDAVGTRVVVTAKGRSQSLDLCGGDGYFASNEKLLVFGLGSAIQADRMEVHWPSGARSAFLDVGAGRVTCIEGMDATFPSLPPGLSLRRR